MQILTTEGFREIEDTEVVGAYATYMLMPLERARNFFRVVMQGRQPFPVQGLGFVIPNDLTEDIGSSILME